MKIKHVRPVKALKNLILLLLLPGFFMIQMAGMTHAAAKMDYNEFVNKVDVAAQKECSSQKFTRPEFKDDCLRAYRDYAIKAYFASSLSAVNKLKQVGCTNPTLWSNSGYGSCNAAIAGITHGQSIMNKTSSPAPNQNSQNSGGSSGQKNSPGTNNAGTNTNNKTNQNQPPPISACDKAKDANEQKKCKQEYRQCNRPPYSLSHIADCKKKVINDYTGNTTNDKKEGKKDNDKNKNKNESDGGGGQGQHCDGENNCDLVKLYVNPFIRLLTILVGVTVAASLVMGGIQYTASGGDAQKISAAKTRITNTLMAFFTYAFMYAFLNFLIPGGVF